jgi:TatD DNase family protein
MIDSHCHLASEELFNDIDKYLKLMCDACITHALCVSTDEQDVLRVTNIAAKYENIFASVGIHPDNNLESDYHLNNMLNLKQQLHSWITEYVVAIGETGLDYYRMDNISATEISRIKHLQQSRFITHIEVAKSLHLPLIIHTRCSIDDTLSIMQEYDVQNAVMHCFTENINNAKKVLNCGYYISISGIVTFKNAHDVQAVAKYVPDDRLLIETDAPFLAPIPYRGKLNHPALLVHTAEYIATLRSMDIKLLSVITSNNFFKLFIQN